MDVSGKVIVITGGANGIGLATAELMARASARVVIMDMDEEALALATQQLPGEVLAIQANVADEASVTSAFDQVVEKWGRVDVAVLNAGILRDGLLVKVDRETGKVKGKLSLQQWQSVIDVNLTGVFLTGREAAVRMIDGGNPGVLVLLSSIARQGNVGQSNYSAAKAGVAALVRGWGRELSRFGIRVAGVSPGFIATAMVMKDMKQEMLDKFKKMIPIGRLGEPEEIAHTIQFVIENDLICGTLVEPSGGMTL